MQTIEEKILGIEPIVTETKHLFHIEEGFVTITNGKASRISNKKAQKILGRHRPEIPFYKINPQILHS